MFALTSLFHKPLTATKADKPRRTKKNYAFVRSAATGKPVFSTFFQAAEASKGKAKKRADKRQTVNLATYIKDLVIVAVIILAIAIPQLTLLWYPVLGVYASAVSLVTLMGLALWHEQVRKLALSMAIVPTTLLVSLCLPQADTFARTEVYYDVMLLLSLIYAHLYADNVPRSTWSLGIKQAYLLPLMVVIGQALGVIGFGMLRGVYPFYGTPLPLVAGTVVVFALTEELLFRGLIQRQAMKVMPSLIAAVITAVSYAVVFAAHGSIMPFAFAVISGAALSSIYYFKQSLLLTTTTNIAMKLIFVGLMATFVLR